MSTQMGNLFRSRITMGRNMESIEYFSGIYKYFTILIPDIFHRFKPTFGEIGQK
jgi:hypothetical protein